MLGTNMRSRLKLASICALAATAAAVSPIHVKQQEFVDADSGERLMIVGVDYQPGGQGAYGTDSGDPLSNATVCLRDAALMQSLGINTIRSYNVDPTLNHDACVSIFNAVGIYMIIDVNSPLPGQSLDRSNPAGSYTADYLQHIFTVVEAFKDYPNTLGFFAGNEIINDIGTAKDNPRYIRAIQRDLKTYIKNHAPRTIPVGYSAAQVQEVLHDSWAYLQCNNGDEDMSRSDFFGLNSYSWCGSGSSFTTSGYDVLVNWFANSTIPVFFSEYGCNKPTPRLFEEVPVLYGPQMSSLSGGLVYEWTQETSDYGLTQIHDNGTVTLLRDYNTLAAQYKKLNVTLITTSNDTATNLKAPDCRSSLITNPNDFSTDFNIPDVPPGASSLIANGVENAPKGKIVRITQTVVPVAVYQPNGAQVPNLAITVQSSANRPGSGELPTGSGSGAGHASSTSTGLAPHATVMRSGGAVAAALFGAGLVVL